MEDPVKEIPALARGLLERPSFRQQAQLLQHYFAADAQFHHYLVDVNTGIDDIVAVYQMAHAVSNYQAVVVQKILYDRTTDHMALKIMVYSRPWISFYREIASELLVQLHLEDWRQPDGKVLKRVKMQRDFFERDPFLMALPVIGPIYGSTKLRFLIGYVEAFAFESLRYLFTLFLPSRIKHGLLGLWVHAQAIRRKRTHQKTH
ncbi:hypothetical protein KP509_09G054300 [Ceratopteris richardii]|uniref:SigF-like NTF2-like domain-containing protein n=1 Tax=Ceratopteris richardii TaxID=49495 RepID=A0A8T2U0C1_CERRI|nr:hypothetical protein KP509_09G054300 [Ceratopteris richardii]